MDRRGFIRNTIATAAAVGCGAALGPLSPGEAEAEALPIRPPGALPEDEFISRCIRCMRCVDACPNHAIMSIDDFGSERNATPAIQPRRQACMLCNKIEGNYLKCTEVCPSGALQLVEKTPDAIQTGVAMGIAEIDFDLCYSYNDWSCGACVRACPFPGEAMSVGMWERPQVHADKCIGCGLCERACIRYPQAIRIRAEAKA